MRDKEQEARDLKLKQEIIDRICRLDPAYEDIDISSYSMSQLLYLQDYIETDPDNPNVENEE